MSKMIPAWSRNPAQRAFFECVIKPVAHSDRQHQNALFVVCIGAAAQNSSVIIVGSVIFAHRRVEDARKICHCVSNERDGELCPFSLFLYGTTIGVEGSYIGAFHSLILLCKINRDTKGPEFYVHIFVVRGANRERIFFILEFVCKKAFFCGGVWCAMFQDVVGGVWCAMFQDVVGKKDGDGVVGGGTQVGAKVGDAVRRRHKRISLVEYYKYKVHPWVIQRRDQLWKLLVKHYINIGNTALAVLVVLFLFWLLLAVADVPAGPQRAQQRGAVPTGGGQVHVHPFAVRNR
jgi:hypothetical protein